MPSPVKRMIRTPILAWGAAMTTATDGAWPVNEWFDPLSGDFLADPSGVRAALPRDEQPIFFAPSIGYYVLTRYADIEQVLQDPAAYSAAVAQAPLVPLVPEAQRILLAGGHKPQPSMVSLDEPEHARLRKPAARAFSMKRVTAMIPPSDAVLPATRQYRLLPDGRSRAGLRAAQALVWLPGGPGLGAPRAGGS